MGCLQGYRRRRFLTLSVGMPLTAWLVGCGGGADESVVEVREEPNARALGDVSASREQPGRSKRRARSYARKGVTAIAIAPDGSTVAVAYADGRLRLLDGAGALDRRLLRRRGDSAVVGLVFSGDGRYLVSVGRDSAAEFWSVESGERRWVVHGHEHALRSVTANADGSIVATAGDETRVMVWDGNSGKLKRVFGGHTDFVNTVSLSPSGHLVASGDAAARILVSQVAKGGLLYTLRGHADEINALAFSPDGKLLASAGEDGKLILWDMSTGHQQSALQGHRAALRSLSFSQDGGLLVAGGVDGRVSVWDMGTRVLVRDVAGSPGGVNVVVFDRFRRNQVFVGDDQDAMVALRL
jgi:WD40 repeat protein